MRGRILSLGLTALAILLAAAPGGFAQGERDSWLDRAAPDPSAARAADSAAARDAGGESPIDPAGLAGVMRFNMSSLEEILRAHLLPEEENSSLTEIFHADSSLALSLYQLRGEENPRIHGRSDLWIYIWRGRGRILLESGELDYGPGQFIEIPAGTLHAFRNISGAPTVGLIWQRPPMDAAEMVEIVSPELRAQLAADSLRREELGQRSQYKSPR